MRIYLPQNQKNKNHTQAGARQLDKIIFPNAFLGSNELFEILRTPKPKIYLL